MLHTTLHRSLSGILAGVGRANPSFMQVAHELSPNRAAKISALC